MAEATTGDDAVSAMYLPTGYLVYVSVTFRAPFIAFWLRTGIKLLFEYRGISTPVRMFERF